MCVKRQNVNCMKLILACVVTSLALQVLGFLSPLWLNVGIEAVDLMAVSNISDRAVNEQNNESATNWTLNKSETDEFGNVVNKSMVSIGRSFGLWYFITCVNFNCSYIEYSSLDDATPPVIEQYYQGYNLSWVDSNIPASKQKEYLIEAIIALSLLFVAMLQVWHHKRLYSTDRTGALTEKSHAYQNCISVVFLLISCGLLWIPVKSYIKANSRFREFLLQEEHFINSTIYSQVTLHIPYSVIFSGFGIALTAIACMLIIVMMSIVHVEQSRRNNVSVHMRRNENNSTLRTFYGSNNVEGEYNLDEFEMCSYLPAETRWSSLHESSDNIQYSTRMNEEPPPSYEEVMRLNVERGQ